MLLFGGWQDLFLDQTLAQFRHLRGRGVTTALTVGPVDAHPGDDQGRPDRPPGVAGLARRSPRRQRPAARAAPVASTSTASGWLDLPDWPPADGRARAVSAPGAPALGRRPPTTRAAVDVHLRPRRPDAHHRRPAAVLGGRLPRRHPPRAAPRRRSTSPATRWPPISTSSAPRSSSCPTRRDNPNNDVFVRLSEVDADGPVDERHRRIRQAAQHGFRTVRLDLDAVAHRFRAGSRLRVLVAGGSHPRFVRNLGTDEPPSPARR